MSPAVIRYTTIMHPRITDQKKRTWTTADYVAVPAIALYGTFPLGSMLSNQSMHNLITVYNRIMKQEKK